MSPAAAADAASKRRLAAEFGRFLIVGAANTGAAYAVYLALVHWLRYELAYAIAYAAGIVVAYLLNAGFVFREPLRARSALRFPLVYVVQFVVGIVVLRVAIGVFAAPHWLAFASSIAATVPLTFVLSRRVVRGG